MFEQMPIYSLLIRVETDSEKESKEENFHLQYLAERLQAAALQCRSSPATHKSRRQCQHLANMCVLHEYSQNIQQSPCQALEEVRRSTFNKLTAPFFHNITNCLYLVSRLYLHCFTITRRPPLSSFEKVRLTGFTVLPRGKRFI